MNKVNARKEFFRVPLAVIREEIEKLGVVAKWTITAEAKEYRETLALERTLKENPEKGRAWLQQHVQASEPTAEDVGEDEDAAVASK
jgi:hypothetical protein